ncbi:MAG: 2,3-bisphosphoglycerate-dependent phosphoglycerate mutase [Actinomycetales bacterium]|nr:2,3-bisphosphoglycerate-dependent phosphoglycerate mutase [Actinomycetales bacterium]
MVSDGILILLRHGESVFNAASIFTGLLDVDVSERGREQARAAGRLIAASGLTPETIWTSPMRRAAVTTDLVCAELGIDPASARSTWRLAERDYGSLTGVPKSEARERYGAEGYITVRRTLDGSPGPATPEQAAAWSVRPYAQPGSGLPEPGAGEALRDVIERVTPVWDQLRGALAGRARVLVVAHGNSLRALCAVVDGLSPQEVQDLNIPPGEPLVYRWTGTGVAPRGGEYLSDAAHDAVALIAREGGT